MNHLYRFGDFVLDPRKRSLSRAGSNLSLTPKAFDVLHFLVQNPSRLITKEELLHSVWGDAFVEEGNLTQYISHLRKALGDNSEDARLIVTIARKGYQFTPDVTFTETPDAAKQSAVQVSTLESSSADAQRALGNPTAAVPIAKAPKHWWKSAVAGLSAACFAVVCFASWRHFDEKTPPRPQKSMLAVLPFENLTGDPDKEYLADGLTEETISEIARLNPEQLGVVPRSTVMGYKHKDQRLDRIGRDLSVQYVLENRLRQSGNHVRLTAQLIQVKDQTLLWSQEFDYAAKDILNIEGEVANTVAREIRVRLTSQQQAGLAQSQPLNTEAFDAYLRGHYYFERDSDKDTELAAKYFERATQLDPSYALAWAALSRVRKWQALRGLVPKDEGNRAARAEVERALALNPNLPEALIQLGRLQGQVDFDWIGWDVSNRRALELEPADSETLVAAAGSARYLGRIDESLRLSHQAVDLDPLNATNLESLAETEFFAEELDAAGTDAKKSLDLNPEIWPGSILLSRIYLAQGRPREALPEIERVRYDVLQTYLYARAYRALGRERESDASLSKLIAKYSATNAYEIALVYASRNQADKAFDWLDRAYAERDPGLMATKADPELKGLRNDPRFTALLKKINLPI